MRAECASAASCPPPTWPHFLTWSHQRRSSACCRSYIVAQAPCLTAASCEPVAAPTQSDHPSPRSFPFLPESPPSLASCGPVRGVVLESQVAIYRSLSAESASDSQDSFRPRRTFQIGPTTSSWQNKRCSREPVRCILLRPRSSSERFLGSLFLREGLWSRHSCCVADVCIRLNSQNLILGTQPSIS